MIVAKNLFCALFIDKNSTEGNMLADFHSHTKYSNCGRDTPEDLVQAMIGHGVDVLGISDHNYGIGKRTEEYLKEIGTLKETYKDQITLYCGIELCTLPGLQLQDRSRLTRFDYCLVENLDQAESIMHGDILEYTKDFHIPVIIAHTDLFSFMKNKELDPLPYLKALKAHNILFELNVSYDSVHQYREHEYVKEFFRNEEQQRLVKESGLQLSVGFDGHRMEDYRADRVRFACEFLEKNGIPFLKKL